MVTAVLPPDAHERIQFVKPKDLREVMDPAFLSTGNGIPLGSLGADVVEYGGDCNKTYDPIQWIGEMRLKVEAHCQAVSQQHPPREDATFITSAITVSEEEEEEEFFDAQQELLSDSNSATSSTSSLAKRKKRVSFASSSDANGNANANVNVNGSSEGHQPWHERSIRIQERSSVLASRHSMDSGRRPSIDSSTTTQEDGALVARDFWSKGRSWMVGGWQWIHWLWAMVRARRSLSQGVVVLILLSLVWKRFGARRRRVVQ